MVREERTFQKKGKAQERRRNVEGTFGAQGGNPVDYGWREIGGKAEPARVG